MVQIDRLCQHIILKARVCVPILLQLIKQVLVCCHVMLLMVKRAKVCVHILLLVDQRALSSHILLFFGQKARMRIVPSLYKDFIMHTVCTID